MRDYRKLRAFELADDAVILVYRLTKGYPKEELYGLTSQIRRAAVSVASNIVEGSARNSQNEYLRFLEISYGSCQELGYQLTIGERLGFADPIAGGKTREAVEETSRVLAGLILSLRSSL